MNIEETANNLKTGQSLNLAYKHAERDRPWLIELLQKSYMKMGSKVKLHSSKDGYVAFQQAAFIMDELALTISAIYENHIEILKKEHGIVD